MIRYHDETLLEMVEMYAEEVGNIASEEELSKLFDDEVVADIIAAVGDDDTDAINEGFNNWTDALCKDRVIHPQQYNSYDYVGKYS